MTRAVPPQAVALTKNFEKCVLTCYSSDGSGTPTIGWGHTKGLTLDDVGVKTITQAQADQLLDADYDAAADELLRQSSQAAVDAMTDSQYGALTDFVFNTGSMGPTLRRLVVARQFDMVPPEMSKYVYAHIGGKTVKLLGLVRRRNAETELFATEEPGTVQQSVPSSGSLQSVSTPPAKAPTPPGARVVAATAVASPVLVAVIATPGVLSQATGVLHQMIPALSSMPRVQGFLTGLLALITAVTPLALWAQALARGQETAGAPSNVADPPQAG